MVSAEDVLNQIDNLLQRAGYDSWRRHQELEFEKVGEAFDDFFADWEKTSTGELRDTISKLERDAELMPARERVSETAFAAALEAARKELGRQAEGGEVYVRPEDGMVDGRIDLEAVLRAALQAAGVGVEP